MLLKSIRSTGAVAVTNFIGECADDFFHLKSEQPALAYATRLGLIRVYACVGSDYLFATSARFTNRTQRVSFVFLGSTVARRNDTGATVQAGRLRGSPDNYFSVCVGPMTLASIKCPSICASQ